MTIRTVSGVTDRLSPKCDVGTARHKTPPIGNRVNFTDPLPGGSIPRSMQTSSPPSFVQAATRLCRTENSACSAATYSPNRADTWPSGRRLYYDCAYDRRQRIRGLRRRVWAGSIDVSLEILVALLISFLIDLLQPGWTRPGHRVREHRLCYRLHLHRAFCRRRLALRRLSESSSHRATIGKRIMDLQVVTADGDKLKFGQASVRHVMKFLSLFSAGYRIPDGRLDQAPPSPSRSPERLPRHSRAGRKLLAVWEKLLDCSLVVGCPIHSFGWDGVGSCYSRSRQFGPTPTSTFSGTLSSCTCSMLLGDQSLHGINFVFRQPRKQVHHAPAEASATAACVRAARHRCESWPA